MDLVQTLSSRFTGSSKPSRIELLEALEQLPDLAVLVQPYVTEPDEYPYGRNVIYKSDDVEIIVVNLPPKSQTFIHDHGRSEGCVRVVRGELVNVIYEVTGPDQVDKILEHKVRANQIFSSPEGIIHQMVNRESQRVVSLHIYAPPLKGLTVYPQPELQNTI
jgi:cysteine dioxygenase